jgi:hypothetical protein
MLFITERKKAMGEDWKKRERFTPRPVLLGSGGGE